MSNKYNNLTASLNERLAESGFGEDILVGYGLEPDQTNKAADTMPFMQIGNTDSSPLRDEYEIARNIAKATDELNKQLNVNLIR